MHDYTISELLVAIEKLHEGHVDKERPFCNNYIKLMTSVSPLLHLKTHACKYVINYPLTDWI